MTRPKKTRGFQPFQVKKTELFSTPFYTMRFIADYEEIVRDVRKAVSLSEQQFPDDPTRNYTTYFNMDAQHKYISNTEWCKQLATSLKDTYVDLMHKEFMFSPKELRLTRDKVHLMLWVNRYTGEHQHLAHNHKGSKISGTFYVKTRQPCAPIVFESPTEYANMIFATQDLPDIFPDDRMGFNGVPAIQKEMNFRPQDGDICLWPSYLYHHVPAQPDQEERISISFNLDHHYDLNFGYSDEVLDKLDYGFLHHE
tara:strand:- start:4918 stop:5679 length:762 start_codon:yes stop_codon:yes gene_type:complete